MWLHAGIRSEREDAANTASVLSTIDEQHQHLMHTETLAAEA